MRICELRFRNFRNFRTQQSPYHSGKVAGDAEQQISFLDAMTESPLDMAVLAGSSGSGKTTILESIEGILTFVGIGYISPEPAWFAEAKRSDMVYAEVELTPQELGRAAEGKSEILRVVIGKSEFAAELTSANHGNLLCYVTRPEPHRPIQITPSFLATLREQTRTMQQGETPLQGGVIFLPHDRKLHPQPRGGAIEPPPPLRHWIDHIHDSTGWAGSLEQLWVWQDYLDVKQQAQGGKATLLPPFLALVETALGQGRKITIEEGRAYATVPWNSNGGHPHKVLLDQLPSGEKQCLLILGELARRRRQNAIILVDEPEVSLHPTLQRLLLHQLRTFADATKSQLILATHSLEILRGVARTSCILLDRIDDRLSTRSEQTETPFQRQGVA